MDLGRILNSLLFAFILLTGQFACQKANSSSNAFWVDASTEQFSDNPDLLERIKATPHGYFRFINIPFSQAICQRFDSSFTGTPSFNLHGDAHLEQYAVTDLGRGLTDYDDSSIGPAVIDLMRLGVSIRLACKELGWESHGDTLFAEFMHGYRDALSNPEINPTEPRVAKAIRSNFSFDRNAYFEWVKSIVDTVSDVEKDSVILALTPYVATMYAENPELNQDYFNVEDVWYLRMGIGSALDLKYLVRLHGETNDPLDDVLLECKQVRDISKIKCIQTGQKTDPFRILTGQARIAYQPFHHLGYFKFRGMIFWVHSWVDNYQEVKISTSFESPEDLSEVVYDIGIQLGKGHVKAIAAPFDLQLRREQLQTLDQCEDKISEASITLTQEVVHAWESFCARLNQNK